MSPEMFQRWRELVDILRLAVKDYRHEWVMSGCLVFALAAVLAPLMVLFGLKYGIIASMFEPLVQDPRNREVRPMGSGRFGPKWFETMRARPDVAFLIPHTRTIAATLKLHVPDADAGRIIDVELIPSATGDPVLDPEVPAPTGYDRVVLSTSAATKLGVHARHRLEASVSRTHRGRLQRETLPLTVAAVAKPGAFNRDGLFVSLELLVAVEDFRDGRRVPALGWQGDDPADEPRVYSGYRLYARSIEDVAALRTYLIEQGLEVRTKAADIELVQALDRNLSIVYWIIVLVALVGYGLSLGASLWANVDRKRREFSVLRLVGFSTHGIQHPRDRVVPRGSGAAFRVARRLARQRELPGRRGDRERDVRREPLTRAVRVRPAPAALLRDDVVNPDRRGQRRGPERHTRSADRALGRTARDLNAPRRPDPWSGWTGS
jgi:putative ABC transport system permease protein